ncbi:MAG: hypothetical protein IJM35_07315 [Bacteroidales bacterium]|nr:hypothetical protein [Bacteroidales bacterium]
MRKSIYLLITAILVIGAVSCKKDKNGNDSSYATGEINAVDLGLSVLWADRNLGAGNPMDIGDCFAWGETTPRPYNSFADPYVFDGSITPTKLSGNCDAAETLLKDGWRMPTKKECEELKTLEKEFITKNGKNIGQKVSGNGNSISIPYPDPNSNSNYINIWTSERLNDPLWAYICYSVDYVGQSRREYSNPIRPVKDKP